MRISQTIQKIIEKIIIYGYKMLSYKGPSFYALEEINLKSQTVVIRCRGTRKTIKQTFDSVISDVKLLEGLPSIHACWIGALYGRALRASLEKGVALKKAKNMSFLLKNTRGRYKIVFQNRNGDIGYFDQKTKKEFVEHPLTVAQSELLISRFDPSQACYIGLLAGISLEKALTIDQKTGQNTAQELFKKMPKLRVID